MKVHNILLLHFLALILTCAILLSLPFSHKKGEKISLIDTFFISTSAVCVTGLSPVDVGTKLSIFGQIILLLFIQLGGLSLASFFIFFSYITTNRLNLFQRKLILSTYTSALKEDFKPLIFSIVLASFLIEFAGALLLFTQFLKKHPFIESFWYSFFHSVSAFCNAGFSLYSENLAVWKENPFVVLITSLLIFIGGIGFIVLSEFYMKLRLKEKLSLHSFVTIKATLILILIGFLFFMVFEWNGVLKGMNFFQKLYVSLFHSVTPRTCGFNLVQINLLNPSTLLLTIILMFIGAAPGSTGGGVKTTTFYSCLLKIWGKIKGDRQCHLKNRAISSESIEMSFYLIIIAISFCFLIFFLLLITENKKFPFDFILFEVISAFGTVGLSCGITPDLSWLSKIFLIILMYFGRIGALVLLSIIQDKKKTTGIIYAEESLLVG